MPGNARTSGSWRRRVRRRAAISPLAPAIALATAILAAGAAGAQQSAGDTATGESSPGLRLKSVIMPPPATGDPSPRQGDGRDATGAGSAAGTAAVAAPRSFRIGIVPRGEADAFLRALKPLRAGIAETLRRPAEILAFADFTALVDAQMSRRIDLGFYSASAFALADRLCSCLDPLVAPAAADGAMAFYGIIVARRQSGIASLDDLQGREIAAGPADSVGSRRIQMAELAAVGIDVATHFSAVKAVRSAVDGIGMVRDGQVDAAFAWSSLTGAAATGYSRGPLADLVRRGQLSMDDVAIIWRSTPIAHAPVAVARSLPGDVRQALVGYFTRLADDEPETYDLIERDYGGGYRAVGRQDYAGALLLARRNAVVGAVEPALPTARRKAAGAAAAPAPIPRGRPQPPGLGGRGGN